MPRLDTKAWEAFWDYWADLIEEVPDAKRTALREMGKAGLTEVWAQLKRSGIHDGYGRVLSWQNMRLGRGGGYAAVSAIEDQVHVTKAGVKTTAKDVTRYLERGHPTRKPSGRAKRYYPRADIEIVPGYLFYSRARMKAQDIALDQASRVLEAMSDAIDDGIYGQGGLLDRMRGT